MNPYRVVGLLVVIAAVAFLAGYKLGEQRAISAATQTGAVAQTGAAAQAAAVAQTGAAGEQPGEEGGCCGPVPDSARNVGTPPAIPTGSGLPCLAEFGSTDCEACKKLKPVFDELEVKLKGKVDVVRVDTAKYPEEASRWRLRLIPTMIFLDAKGKELGRQEGYLSGEEILARLIEVGIIEAQ